MSQYLQLKDLDSDEELFEIGMKTLRVLEQYCGEAAPGFFTDYDLFGFDHGEYYDPAQDGVHTLIFSRERTLAELDSLIARLQAEPDHEIAGRSLADFAIQFGELKRKIEARPQARLTAYSWF